MQQADPQVIAFIIHSDHVKGNDLRHSQNDGEQPDQYDPDGGAFRHSDSFDKAPGGYCTVPCENQTGRLGVFKASTELQPQYSPLCSIIGGLSM